MLESAGANIMKRQALPVIGNEIVQTSIALYNFAEALYNVAEIEGQRGNEVKHNMIMASERIQFASQRMNDAGEALMNSGKEKKKNIKGKGWIKGGL